MKPKISAVKPRYRLLSYLAGEWRAGSIVVTTILSGSLLGLVQPWVWGILLVNGVILEANLSLLPLVMAILLGAALGRNALSFLEDYWAEVVSQRIVYKLRVQLFSH